MDCEDDLSRSAGDSPVQEDLRIGDSQDLGEEQNGSANNGNSLGLKFILYIKLKMNPDMIFEL